MDAATRLRRMFDYDAWANLKFLAVLETNDSFERHDKTMGLFYHLIATQELWYRRATGGDLSGIEVWPDYDLEECRSLIETNHQKWKELIETNQDNLDRVISYHNTKGTPYETRLSDLAHHLIIHGQHHRAQIAMLLRMAGIAPPPSDFIFFTRD